MLRYCEDIGLFRIDRSRRTCRHATRFCRTGCDSNGVKVGKPCYVEKAEKCYPHVLPAHRRYDAEWSLLDRPNTLASLTREKAGKVLPTARIRLCSSGEPFSTVEDIGRVEGILRALAPSSVWIPTRGWRDVELRPQIQRLQGRYRAARVMASIDPSNTWEEIVELVNDGWSTMFYGDDSEHPLDGATDGVVRCPKTWDHKSGHCAKCSVGCFRQDQRHVWLKSH